jgi:prevent-host-death family protein
MPSVGIREFKGRVSHYVDLACRGEEVTITKWGRALARLVGESSPRQPVRDQLALLATEGLITLPTVERSQSLPEPVEVAGRAVSEVVLEERR